MKTAVAGHAEGNMNHQQLVCVVVLCFDIVRCVSGCCATLCAATVWSALLPHALLLCALLMCAMLLCATKTSL